jgi:hypothetical protein
MLLGVSVWAAAFIALLVHTSVAQTPDGETPAEEEACDKYVGEGARHGLCVAYCEAQDCEGIKYGTDPSCDRIAERFVDYSVKQGYEKGKPKPGRPSIDCSTSACTVEDRTLCGGKERDCLNEETRECEEVCSRRFAGYDEKGNPLCLVSPACRKCAKEIEK